MAKKKESLKNKLDIFANETFQYEKLEDIMGDRFGRYSKAIIQERAIPDIRDGLKPVQRRILFGMNQLKLFSTSPTKKCARVVGDVMGKYHPHGDSSIYEALVRLSQDWKMEIPLVYMQGNNGSIDGDGPAASRYTECRLSKNADYLLRDIDKNTVEMIDNYDGEEKEPTVLPARFPNLLVNGAMGISSGYATYIPTHNLKEVINATIAMIDNPDITIDEILEIMPGPDFPTGGIVQGYEGIREAYLTGSGSIVVKSKIEFEEIKDGQKRIVVTEIPYDTIKQKTVEKIEQIRIDKKVDGIEEVRDETDRKGLRIAIDLKKGANAEAILAYLLKNTDLQVNLKYNMVAINEMRPERVGVLKILKAYINHQKDVITNRTNFLKAKASHRLHIVDGLIRMVSILDDVIKTIRKSENKANAKENLITKFDFTEIQADAILSMQLYRLSNTDVVELQEEQKKLNSDIDGYNKILSSEKNLLKVIKKELSDIENEIDTPRKTLVEKQISSIEITESDLISKEDVVVCVSREGYIKRLSLKNYKASTVNTFKEHDSQLKLCQTNTLDIMLAFTTKGNFIYLPVYKIDECKMRDMGTFINNLVSIDSSERLVDVFFIKNFDDSHVLLQTKNGNIKQVLLKDFMVSRYTKSVRAMKISDDDELVSADITNNPLEILTLTKSNELLRFRQSDVSIYGTNAGGIKAIGLKPKDFVVSSRYANVNCDALILTKRQTVKRIKVSELLLSKRARAGILQIKKIKSNPFESLDLKVITPNQNKENTNVTIICEEGQIEMPNRDFKGSQADGGMSIETNGLGLALKLDINKPEKVDEIISDDYLIDTEANMNLFSYDTIDDTPITIKKDKSIESELDKILALEDLNKEENKPVEKEDIKVLENNSEIKISDKTTTIVRRKKVSFFDEDK
jgi:topoisomerase-4 subunit A